MRDKTKFIDREGEGFPKKLLEVRPIVQKLWFRGKWDPVIIEKCVAIVGSRKMSRYGKQVLAEIVPRLVGAGYTIISGLMYGVDQEAHKLALANNGKTIAVLGYGIERKNEYEADKLEEEIIDSGGLILSEYEGMTRGQIWTFPQRNRIVVGLAEAIIVAEAGIKSGSLNTASWARRQGKPIYSVPGGIFSTTSIGTNNLIAHGEAKALTMIELQNLCGGENASATNQMHNLGKLTERQREIELFLKLEGPKSINEISRAVGKGSGEIMALLIQMEIMTIVEEERGVWKVI